MQDISAAADDITKRHDLRADRKDQVRGVVNSFCQL